jgi:hypothetical protein
MPRNLTRKAPRVMRKQKLKPECEDKLESATQSHRGLSATLFADCPQDSVQHLAKNPTQQQKHNRGLSASHWRTVREEKNQQRKLRTAGLSVPWTGLSVAAEINPKESRADSPQALAGRSAKAEQGQSRTSAKAE